MTCATLVLLTFSVLSFTSIRSALRTNWIDVGSGAASGDGALLRMIGWKAMEMEAYRCQPTGLGQSTLHRAHGNRFLFCGFFSRGAI